MNSIVKSAVNWRTHQKVQSPAQNDMCEICGKKPKYVERGFKHPYCSRTCARSAQGPNPIACVLQGCRATGKPAFAGFCSEAHGKDGVRLGQVNGCYHCNVQPQAAGELCITCDRRPRAGPRIKELNVEGAMFKSLRSQFSSEWKTQGDTPTVEKVYEITMPRDVRARHDGYRTKHPMAEEIRSFYSSQCICDLGSKEAALCNFKSCGICNVVKSSFKTFAFSVSYNTGRYGDGIYSYRNPSLADRFATSCTSSPYRVMIACNVIAEQSLIGGNVDIDEAPVFVSNADAIIPAYIIVYTK